MLQDIFDVSKAATGNITLMPEYIGLDKLLRQTLGDMDLSLIHILSRRKCSA